MEHGILQFSSRAKTTIPTIRLLPQGSRLENGSTTHFDSYHPCRHHVSLPSDTFFTLEQKHSNLTTLKAAPIP